MAKNKDWNPGNWPSDYPDPSGGAIAGHIDESGKFHNQPQIENNSDDPIFSGLTFDMTPLEILEQILRNRAKMDTPNVDRDDAYMNLYLQALWRDEDFMRSSPAEQVRRLMEAGMSRSAALQALQEQQYGSVQPTMAGNVEASELAKKQQALAIAQGVVEMLGQVVQCGMQIGASITSIQHTMEATRALALQNDQTKLYGEAQLAIGRYVQAFDNYKDISGAPLPDSLTDMVEIMRNSPFASSVESWNQDMANPFFYPAMRKAYREQAIDPEELARELRMAQTEEDMKDVDLQILTEQLNNWIRNNNFEEETYEDRVQDVHNKTIISGSQAAIAAEDEKYWTSNGNRQKYLSNMNTREYWSARLAKVQFDKTELEYLDVKNLYDELELARRNGKDYYKAKVDEMFLSETNRAIVLQLGQMVNNRNLNREVIADTLDKGGLHLAAGAVRFWNYFVSHGVVDKVLSLAATAAK